jgi:hypothetical protein
MGIDVHSYTGLEKVISNCQTPVKMLEFGAQRLVLKTFDEDHPCRKFAPNLKMCSAKDFFQSLGVEHISIDIIELWDCEYMDLSIVQDKWKGEFDIVTNFGTTEHVRGGQHESFLNCHNFTKPNGFMVHVVPMVGRMQRNHSPEQAVYYSEHFFNNLAEANGYEVLDFYIYGDRRGKAVNIFCAMKKPHDRDFMLEDAFWDIKGINDFSEGQSFTKGHGICPS